MVVLEGGGGPRRSAGTVGIDPGLAFAMDLALSRADETARTLGWQIRRALRTADASANAPVRIEAIGVWALQRRDDTRRRLAILRGGIGTGMAPWGPGDICLPTDLALPAGLGGGLWNDYVGWLGDFENEIVWGEVVATAADNLSRLDDILLVAGIDDAAERANLIHHMIRNGGRIPADIIEAYERSSAAGLVRSVDDLPLGPILTAITLPMDVATWTQGRESDSVEDTVDYGLLTVGIAAGGLEVVGLAASAGLVGTSTGMGIGAVVTFATGPVGLAIIAGVGIVTVAWEVYRNWDTISAAASDALSAAGDAIEAADQWVEDQTDAIADALVEGGEELLQSLGLTIGETVDGVTVWVADTEDALRGTAVDVQAELEQLVGSAVAPGFDTATNVANGLVERGDAALRSVGDTVTIWDR